MPLTYVTALPITEIVLLHDADLGLQRVLELPLGIDFLKCSILFEDGDTLVDLRQENGSVGVALVETDEIIIDVDWGSKQLQLWNRRGTGASTQDIVGGDREVKEEGVKFLLHQVAKGDIAGVGLDVNFWVCQHQRFGLVA